jgi:hypothetical protein
VVSTLRRSPLLLAALVAGSVACGALLDSGADIDFGEPADAMREGDAPASETEADAADGSDAATTDGEAGGPVVFRNGGFEEEPGTVCLPGWRIVTADGATAYRIDGGKTGSHACRLCVGTSLFGRLEQTLPVQEGTYVFDAWVHEDDMDAGPAQAAIRLQRRYDGGADLQLQGAPNTVGAAWTERQLPITTDAGDALTVTLIVSGTTGDCALFDDVTLTYVPP